MVGFVDGSGVVVDLADFRRQTRLGRRIVNGFFLICVAVSAVALVAPTRTFLLHHTGRTTTAVVQSVISHLRSTKNGRFTVYDGVVSFAAAGRETPVGATIGFGRHRPERGDTVRVTYDQDQPTRVQRRSLGVWPINALSGLCLAGTAAYSLFVVFLRRETRQVRRLLTGNVPPAELRGLVRRDAVGKAQQLRLHLLPADGPELAAPVVKTDELPEQGVTVYGDVQRGSRVVVVADGRVIWPAGVLRAPS